MKNSDMIFLPKRDRCSLSGRKIIFFENASYIFASKPWSATTYFIQKFNESIRVCLFNDLLYQKANFNILHHRQMLVDYEKF